MQNRNVLHNKIYSFLATIERVNDEFTPDVDKIRNSFMAALSLSLAVLGLFWMSGVIAYSISKPYWDLVIYAMALPLMVFTFATFVHSMIPFPFSWIKHLCFREKAREDKENLFEIEEEFLERIKPGIDSLPVELRGIYLERIYWALDQDHRPEAKIKAKERISLAYFSIFFLIGLVMDAVGVFIFVWVMS